MAAEVGASELGEDHTDPPTTPSTPAQSLAPRKVIHDPKYMHRPPRIVPNYGKKPRGLLPKSNVSRVLLYDNVTQQQMLAVRLGYLHSEQRKAGRLLDLHRKSFLVRRVQRERQAAGSLLHIGQQLPALPHQPPANKAGQRGVQRAASGRERGGREGDVTGQHRGHRQDDDGSRQKAQTEAEGERDVTDQESSKGDEGGGEGSHLPHSLPALPINTADSSSRSRRHAAQTADPAFFHHQQLTTSQALPEMDDDKWGEDRQSSARHRPWLNMETKNGVTRMLHTYHGELPAGGGRRLQADHPQEEASGLGPVVVEVEEPVGESEGRTSKDVRYLRLERLLVRLQQPNEGYLELSPSFHSPRQAARISRPPSFRPASRLRPAGSSTPPRSRGLATAVRPRPLSTPRAPAAAITTTS